MEDPVVRNPGMPTVENGDSRTSVAVADFIACNGDILRIDDRRDPVCGRRTAAAHDQNRRKGGMPESAVRQGIALNHDIPGHRTLQPEELRLQDDSVEGRA